jgi:hypothetical protein
MQDDDTALAELSADEAAKLEAELDAAERPMKPLQPTSDGVQAESEDGPTPAVLAKEPGQAEAAEFETGMA